MPAITLGAFARWRKVGSIGHVRSPQLRGPFSPKTHAATFSKISVTTYGELGSNTDAKSRDLAYVRLAIFPFITTALVSKSELGEAAVPAS